MDGQDWKIYEALCVFFMEVPHNARFHSALALNGCRIILLVYLFYDNIVVVSYNYRIKRYFQL
uniref:Uncharacterized protein n=1 Tax=Salix viminalis TaxID=40686 RepID=A0A6N2N949_SALVM